MILKEQAQRLTKLKGKRTEFNCKDVFVKKEQSFGCGQREYVSQNLKHTLHFVGLI